MQQSLFSNMLYNLYEITLVLLCLIVVIAPLSLMLLSVDLLRLSIAKVKLLISKYQEFQTRISQSGSGIISISINSFLSSILQVSLILVGFMLAIKLMAITVSLF